jgi:hypothetical protein
MKCCIGVYLGHISNLKVNNMKYRICYKPSHGYFVQVRYNFTWQNLITPQGKEVIYLKTVEEAETLVIEYKQEEEASAERNKVSIIKYGRI